MKILSIETFVPSGSDFEKSKLFFQELGFQINWDAGDYAGLEKDGCKFILQKYDVKAFAENLMLSVKVDDVEAFRADVIAKQLPEKYGIKVSNILQQPYGKEVNIIDVAGVCWHFVQQYYIHFLLGPTALFHACCCSALKNVQAIKRLCFWPCDISIVFTSTAFTRFNT